MNVNYIKTLLKSGRYGKVIHLIKSNVHIWSLDDYHKVYYLCCGLLCDTKTRYISLEFSEYDKELFSDICVEYFTEFVQNNIYDRIQKSYDKYKIDAVNIFEYIIYKNDAVRMFKKSNLYKEMYELRYPTGLQPSNDILKFCIQKGIYFKVLPKMMIYDDYINFLFTSNNRRFIIPPAHSLIEYYVKGEYDKFRILCDNTKLVLSGRNVTICLTNDILNINSCYVIDIIVKYRHILKYFDNIDELLEHVNRSNIDDIIIIYGLAKRYTNNYTISLNKLILFKIHANSIDT
jgi:hypothetical protein